MKHTTMTPARAALGRRQFLSTSGKATAAALALGVAPSSRAFAANETVRAAVVGVRGRGKNHLDALAELKGVEVVAVCDIDEEELEKSAAEVEKRSGKKPAKHIDMRKLFEDPSIDVVSFATPNHWHALGGIWAMEAGKDVYVEKPCSHNVFEGRMLVEAARRHQKIVQHGTQIRSAAAIRQAVSLLGEGVIGDVYMAKGLCYKWRSTIGRTPDEDPPAGVHYDLWLGPAPARPYSRNRFHYNWHWHWDYGNGDIGNQGVHQMDVARWGLGVGLPRKIQSMGGHYLFDDDQETPNTQIATFSYPEEEKMIVFEVRHWITNDENVGSRGGNAVGNIFYGSEGIMVMDSYTSFKVFLGKKHEPGPSGNAGGDHFANFMDAVRKRDPKLLNAPIEEGHLSSALGHLANVSYRLGRTLDFDPKTEKCVGDEEANALLRRAYREPFVVKDLS